MPKFAANLTMLFNEVGFIDRFEAAKRAGFRGVEYLFPYAYPPALLAEQLQHHNLTQVLHNLPAGDWERGDRGIACHPRRVGEFQDSVGRAIEYATALGCRQLNCLAGTVPDDEDPARVRATLISNLRFAARELRAAGIGLLIEAINTRDIPNFYLCHSQQALEILDAVGADNLRLQYDVYHMQVMEGDLTHTIEHAIDCIGHIQVADNPGRHEPGTGEINYPFLFRRLDELGYDGWVGCEYSPTTTTSEGLGWLQALRTQTR